MQKEMYDYLKTGKTLCAMEAVVIFKITRQHASNQLSRLEKSNSDVVYFFVQKHKGSNCYTEKHYKINL